jgi:hypothetical protein
MKQEGNILTVSEGKEIYNLSNPDVYGKRVKLGEGDTANNWGERNETIVEQEEGMFYVTENVTTQNNIRGNSKLKGNKLKNKIEINPKEINSEHIFNKKKSLKLFDILKSFLFFWKK